MHPRQLVSRLTNSLGAEYFGSSRRPRGLGAIAVLVPLLFAGAANAHPQASPAAAPAITLPTIVAPAASQTSPTQNFPSQTAPGPTSANATGRSAQNSATRSDSTRPDATRPDPTSTDAQKRSGRTDALPEPQLSEFQQLVLSTTGQRLPIFGQSLFSGVPSTFAPVDNVPVGPGYILGPGDELDLGLTGQINQQFALTVDRTGAIQIPGLGSVHVAGLPYGRLPDFLNTQLGRIYRNFDLNVNLGALRTIQVFVVGQARRPGSFSISSLSTLLNALFASGGPAPTGSVRDIQVRRGNQTVEHFDLYDLLLRGDKSHDLALANGDVIFIPVAGPEVAVLGSITTSAIYELQNPQTKGPTSVADVIALAGGPTAVAAAGSVRLERIFEHTLRSVEDIHLADVGPTIGPANSTGPATATAGAATPLQNGDILSISSILDRFRDAVTLRGNVASPGRYVWHPGMRIADILPNREALITRNYWRKRNQLGQAVPDYLPGGIATTEPEGALQVRGGGAPNGQATLPADRTSTSTDVGGNSVAVALAGNNTVFEARNDVVLSAPDIDWSYAVIERQDSKTLTTSLIPFNLGRIVLDGDASQNLELLPGDVVTIFSKADLRVPTNQQTRFVRLEGEFNASGVYSVLPGETLRGLLRRAGGFTSDAYLYASEFTRESTRRVEAQRLREYADQLEAQISSIITTNQTRAVSAADQAAALASSSAARAAVVRLRQIQPIGRIVLDLQPSSAGIDAVPDLALEDGDRFVLPRVPANVTVEGQVYSANAFVYQPSQRVLDYLKRAGGPDRQADRRRTFLLRADGSVVSRQYNNVDRAPIFPGDTVVVPPILEKHDIFQRILSIAALLGNLGTPVATLAILARQ